MPLKADYAPESYNLLRKELHDYWPAIWNTPIQWMMAFDWPLFIEHMNLKLDLRVSFDVDVSTICQLYLDTLLQRRGRLHS